MSELPQYKVKLDHKDLNKDLDGEVKHGKNEESKDNHKEKKQAKYFCYFHK